MLICISVNRMGSLWRWGWIWWPLWMWGCGLCGRYEYGDVDFVDIMTMGRNSWFDNRTNREKVKICVGLLIWVVRK